MAFGCDGGEEERREFVVSFFYMLDSDWFRLKCIKMINSMNFMLKHRAFSCIQCCHLRRVNQHEGHKFHHPTSGIRRPHRDLDNTKMLKF